jgi:hypothetical protein
MHATIDIWVNESDILANLTQSGIVIRGDDGDAVVNIFLGHTASEMEHSRAKINLAMTEAVRQRALLTPPEESHA